MRKCISMLVSLAIGISAFAPLSALAAEEEPVQISTPEELQAAVTNGAQNGVASANSYYTIDIKDSKIYGTTTGIAATMGYVMVTDSEVGAITADNASTLSLSGSTINSAGSGIAAYKTASASLDGCTVNGGTYNGVFALNSASRTSLKIYGGLFSADPSKYLADGLGAVF